MRRFIFAERSGIYIIDLQKTLRQIQKAQDGSYALAGRGDSTTVTYSLAVDLNIPMIGMLRRKAEKVIIDTALKGLKRRVEALSK